MIVRTKYILHTLNGNFCKLKPMFLFYLGYYTNLHDLLNYCTFQWKFSGVNSVVRFSPYLISSSLLSLSEFYHLPPLLFLLNVDEVILCLRTAATNGPTVHPSGGTWVWWAKVERYWQRKTKELGEKRVPVSLCPPQIPHELTWARNRAPAVTGRRLTAWATVRPSFN
jgi:hypothetical protein